MRVLMHVRPTSRSVLAGDAVQARATAEALRALGIEVDLAETAALPSLRDYDLVHLFNLMPIEATHKAYTEARAAGRPVVLSTVFWDPGEFLAACDPGGGLASWWRRTDPLRREVLAGARVILPNGRAELDCLRRVYGSLPPAVVVPNGVDVSLFHPRRPPARLAPHVLCVGRIGVRKNQLGLLHALRGTGLAIEFIGPVNDFAYYRACRAASWPGVRFREELHGAKLAAAFAAAPVHALVSWYETPGLASLEAAACGCRIVSTDRGCAREYLGDDAWYCAPDDAEGIRRAVLGALAGKSSPGLAEKVRGRYNWDEAAKATREGYELALRGQGQGG